jgi:sigma-B regulation protein RsbU (phosphoserine phosphatase)
VAQRLNQRLSGDTGVIEYSTMVYGTADLHSGEIKLVQAGHPPPLVIRGNGHMEFLGQGGLPIGLIADANYSGFQTVLNPGDKILLYSDRLTKGETQSGEMLEEEGLMGLVYTCDVNASGQAF